MQKRNPDGTCFAAVVTGLSHYRAALTSVAKAPPSNCALAPCPQEHHASDRCNVIWVTLGGIHSKRYGTVKLEC